MSPGTQGASISAAKRAPARPVVGARKVLDYEPEYPALVEPATRFVE